jgi:hypothetical protein
MTQQKLTASSTKLSESEAIAYWDQKLQALDDRLRASGHTVTVQEPSDSTEFVVSFPPARRLVGLRAAYQAALYEFIAEERTYSLKVGEQNAEVADFLKSLNATGAAFITAYNPASLQLGQIHNTMANKALKSDLKDAKVSVFLGEGRDAAGAWPPESSFLVVGIARGQAEALARKYGQYAMLWIEADGAVSLVELADLDKAQRYPLKVPPFAWVELGFNWGYEWANLRITPSDWRQILEGADFSKTSRQGNDGEVFTLTWDFSKGTDLYVNYGDDGGTAFDGKISHLSLDLKAR